MHKPLIQGDLRILSRILLDARLLADAGRHRHQVDTKAAAGSGTVAGPAPVGVHYWRMQKSVFWPRR